MRNSRFRRKRIRNVGTCDCRDDTIVIQTVLHKTHTHKDQLIITHSHTRKRTHSHTQTHHLLARFASKTRQRQRHDDDDLATRRVLWRVVCEIMCAKMMIWRRVRNLCASNQLPCAAGFVYVCAKRCERARARKLKRMDWFKRAPVTVQARY